jgi:hypothetical protein
MKAGLLVLAIGMTTGAFAQETKPVGSVPAADAKVTNASAAEIAVSNGKRVLAGNVTVTANPGRNAEVSLKRGGAVLVCQSTALHVTPGAGDALLLALDRGSMEIRTKADTNDVIMTPDLRFTMAQAGTLDLRMRVIFNGDTCVDNHGRKAPQLNITDAFGDTSYILKPGQHVMFEHGSLREVDDGETTPCGCPPEEKQPASMSVAEALLRGGQSTPTIPEQAEATHPFPAAVSDGLTPPSSAVPEKPGERHVQVAGTLAFDPAVGGGEIKPPVPPAPASPKVPATSAPVPRKTGTLAAIGRFFKRIFVR